MPLEDDLAAFDTARIAQLENENGFLEAENALLQARVDELLQQLIDSATVLQESTETIIELDEQVALLLAHRTYLIQVLLTIDRYYGTDVSVLRDLANVAIRDYLPDTLEIELVD